MVVWNYFLIWNQETSEQLCASYIQDILTNKNIVTFIFKLFENECKQGVVVGVIVW